jgi:hypothetical protein
VYGRRGLDNSDEGYGLGLERSLSVIHDLPIKGLAPFWTVGARLKLGKAYSRPITKQGKGLRLWIIASGIRFKCTCNH